MHRRDGLAIRASRARLIVARSSKAFACIVWASAIASRKSASEGSVCPTFAPQFPPAGQIIRPEDAFLGVRMERLVDGDESVVHLPSRAWASARRVR